MKKKKIMGAIKFAILLLIALTQLFPLYWLITFSLKSNTEIFGENVIGLPHVLRWDNYVTALSSSNLIRYFLNSVFYSVVTVVAAGIISSMAAYLSVELDSGDVAHFYLRYENPTKKTISVAEASVTFIEVKYDEYAEEEYDKAAKGIEVETSQGTLALNNKVKYAQVRKLFGDPEQETDGRFHYTDDAGYKYMFDCCNENRNGIFRGFSIEYPSK